MTNTSRYELSRKIHSEYNKKLKEFESKLASKHKELSKVEQGIRHESKKTHDSNLSVLKAKRGELNASIFKLTKEIKQINKEKVKKLRKLRIYFLPKC